MDDPAFIDVGPAPTLTSAALRETLVDLIGGSAAVTFILMEGKQYLEV